MNTVKPRRYHTAAAVYDEVERLDETTNAALRKILHADEPTVRHALNTLREWGVVRITRNDKQCGRAYWGATDEPLPSLEAATIGGVQPSTRCGAYDHRALTQACRGLSATCDSGA